METVLVFPANAALGRAETLVRIAAVEVIRAGVLRAGGEAIPISAAEYAFIKSHVTLLPVS
jgi:hypothetical protein